MKEEGTLERGTLISLIRDHVTARKWGLLFIYSEDHKTLIHITEEGVELLADSSSRWEEEYLLVQRGYISENQLNKARRIAKETNKDLKPVINEQGFATSDQFEKAARNQAWEILLDAFLLQDVDYEFRDEDRRSDIDQKLMPPFKFVFDHEEVLEEAQNRLSEFETQKTLISDRSQRFTVKEENLPEHREVANQTRMERIIDEIEQAKSVGEILHELNFSVFETYKILADLSMSGALQPMTEEEVLEAARNKMDQDGEMETCVRLYKTYLSNNPENLQVREELADALIAAGEDEDAAELLLDTARMHLKEHEKQKAHQLLKIAYNHDPENQRVQEVWFDTVLDLNDPKRIRETGEELIHSQMKAGNLQEASRVLNKLLNRFPHSIRLLMTGADLARQRDQTRKLKSYLSRSVEALPENISEGSLEAVEYLKKSTQNPDELDENIRAAVGYSSPFFSMRKMVIAFVVLGLGAGMYFLVQFQMGTRLTYFQIDRKANQDVQSGMIEEGLKRYEKFIEQNPFSYKRWAARQRIQELKRRLKEQEKAEKKAQAKNPDTDGSKEAPSVGKKLEKIREQYLSPGEGIALRTIEQELLALKGESEGPDKEEIEEMLGKIEERRREASSLLKQAKSSTDKGNLREARELIDRIRKEYSRTETASNLFYPVRFKSLPPNVKLYINNQLVGTTPLTHRFEKLENHKVTAVRRHFEKKQMIVMPLDQAQYDLTLQKKIAWEKDLSSSITAPPLLQPGGIIAGTEEGYLWRGSYDRRQIWGTTLKTDTAIQHLVSGTEDSIYVMLEDSTLLRVSPSMGKGVLWKKKFSDHHLLKPVIDSRSDLVLVPSRSGTLFAINTETGEVQSSISLSASPISSVRTINERLFILLSNRQIVELDLARSRTKNAFQVIPESNESIITSWTDGARWFLHTNQGKILKARPLKQETETVLRLDRSLFPGFNLVNSILHFTTEDATLYRWQLGSDSPVWKRPLPAPASTAPVHADKMVYVADRNGNLHAFHGPTGRIFWTRKIPYGIPKSGLVVRESNLIFGTDEGYLYLLKLGSYR